MEEITVVRSSGKWKHPIERTYHIHMDELLESFDDEHSEETPDLDLALDVTDGDTPISISRYCLSSGEVVGGIGPVNKLVGADVGAETAFAPRDEFTEWTEHIATLIEGELIPEVRQKDTDNDG